MLTSALCTVLGFLLGLRLGIALGYRGERRRRAALERARATS
ncbi:MAG TPA: hypothetical protein VNO21_11070 [Polyangiaceae bacterium]|nr:hypothetical protein [Polyangiaceae bacterium]